MEDARVGVTGSAAEAARLRALLERECTFSAMRAQGAGGQNVNKVESAVHLRFDVRASSLSAPHRERLLALADQRLNEAGVIVIKAQEHRTQTRNREEAIDRLLELVLRTAKPPKKRLATRPTLASRERRLQSKTRRGQLKSGRGRIAE